MKKILNFIVNLFIAAGVFSGIVGMFFEISECPCGWDFQMVVLYVLFVFVVLTPFACMLATKDDQN